jgi:predicted porin
MRIPLALKHGPILLSLTLAAPRLVAQDGGQVHGNFSTDIQYYNEDSAIGAVVLPQKMGANAWANLIYTNGAFEAGGRFESYTPALAGYPAGLPFSGSGVGFRYARYTMSDLEVTVGNFFEQFGQGMIFRSYEERYLGVDNAMDGIRVKYRPVPGIMLKGFIGQQRLNFVNEAVKGPGTVRGFDAEISLSEFFDSTWTSANNLILGGSFVSKYQEDRDPLLELPENVGAYAVRANYTTPKWNLYAEYAYKINDPNNKNGFIYKDGQGLLLNATYSVKGFGLSMGAHSFDNMFYQSDRSAATPFDLNINFLPPLAKQHTYNLPATLYPYATQPNSEWAAQGELFYKWKKGTKLGGKYGTKIALNGSVAYSQDTTRLGAVDDTTARRGYTSRFFTPGERRYFQDINVELRKKVSEHWELALTYLNVAYDIDIIQGKPGKPVIYADMVILEGLHNFSDRTSLRFELQHLSTKQDQGNWATALAELTFSPHWFVAAMDQYNYIGNPELESKGQEPLHYPIGSVGYIRGGNRFQMNYGRQRAGIFCVGGVCRQVPAANGLTLSITSTF